MIPFGKTKVQGLVLAILFCLFIILFNGCTGMNYSGTPADSTVVEESPDTSPATSGVEPYYPTDFKDLLVPGELEWNRNESIALNTSSYAGGVLSFGGRVEVNSLTEFFINAMKKNGWEITGTIKAKDIMLAFVKPHGSCIIRIFEGSYGSKTNVVVYITTVPEQ